MRIAFYFRATPCSPPPKKTGGFAPGAEIPSYATEKRCRKGERALVTVHTVASSESSAIEVWPVSVLRGGIACAKVIRFAIQWAYFLLMYLASRTFSHCLRKVLLGLFTAAFFI